MAKSKDMTLGTYAMSLLGVGVLFFMIGYGYQKGRDIAQ